MDGRAISGLLVGLQVFHLVFLLLHDWVRLGRLNDVEAQRRTDSFGKRLVITLVTAAPFAALLLSSVQAVHAAAWPPSLLRWLWLAYGLLFLGELRAWWLPYLLRPEPDRAERYRALFGQTQAFLPERNGIRPNTLHTLLHTATFATLLCLAWLSFR